MGEPIGGKTATHQAQYCAAPRFFVGTRQVQRPIIGGLGDLWGTLVGGVILAVAQTLGARINPGYQILAGHIVFLTILALRPQGFFQKTR
jgi:branched-subunit amino acid ABC-type transport system permease component